VNLNTGDFNLTLESLAVNHGRQLPTGWPDTSVVTDGIPDIGAFEYGETVEPENPSECTPQCEDYECGDDNCGGSCGICPEGRVCKRHLCKIQKKYTIVDIDIAPIHNPDGLVNMYDLSLVLANWKWKKEPRDEKADLNEDGVVDMLDIALIESYWTKKY
jgi:hypothetical protein